MSDNDRIHVWVQRFPDRSTLQLQWIDPETGKRKTRSARTDNEEKAEKARADLEYELAHGVYKEASRMTWAKFRELLEAEHIAGKRPNTRRNYRTTLDLFEKLCSPGNLRSVNERMLSKFVAKMRELPCRGRVGLSASTIRVRLEAMRSALGWAAGQKLIPACPKVPAVKVPRKKPQPVPAESFERLLERAPDANMRAYLLAGWLAGLRLSEAAALEWEPTDHAPYVDFARRRIVLPAEIVKAVEDQWVPLDDVLRAALEQLPRNGPLVFRFVGPDGEPISATGIGERVIRLAKKAGVKLTMHSLRRGFGCRYAGKVPAQVLQRLMRHANISTTMGFYANVDDAVMDAVLGPQRNGSRNTQPPTANSPAEQDGASPLPDCDNAESL